MSDHNSRTPRPVLLKFVLWSSGEPREFCMSDHNSRTPRLISLKFLVWNSGEPRECLKLGLKVRMNSLTRSKKKLFQGKFGFLN